MKYLLTLLTLSLCSVFSNAQNAIVGKWEINENKHLEFKADKTFELVTSDKVKTGKYMTGKAKDGQKALILYIGEKKVSYYVKSMTYNKMVLFSPSKNKTMTINRVQEIIEVEEAPIKVYAIQDQKPQYKSPKRPFDHFDTGRAIVSLQYGVIDYIDNIPGDAVSSTPAISLLYERSRGYRIGLGTKWSYRNWKTQTEGVTAKFDLLVAAPRVTYHPKLVNKLDFYGGLAFPFSVGLIRVEDERSFKLNYGISPVIGARYYPTKRLGLSAEFAYDNTTNVNVGIAVALN